MRFNFLFLLLFLFFSISCNQRDWEDELVTQEETEGDWQNENINILTPQITGLSDDAIPKSSKTWNWSCNDLEGGCLYRFVINQTAIRPNLSHLIFEKDSSATLVSGSGIYYIHIQAINSYNLMSQVKTFSAILGTDILSTDSTSSKNLNIVPIQFMMGFL